MKTELGTFFLNLGNILDLGDYFSLFFSFYFPFYYAVIVPVCVSYIFLYILIFVNPAGLGGRFRLVHSLQYSGAGQCTQL